MYVVATAGHVDHGKSTLVRALTGMEPDRFAEERRRGLTIDLGYAWTKLPSGQEIAFVDVPGHERFIANMLAGLGPAPGVLFVVAADAGWSRQSEEHLAAIDALQLRHGLLAVTRSDLRSPEQALRESRERIARSSLGEVAAVACSGVTGAGLDELRTGLDRLCAAIAPPDPREPVRLWLDRVFTVRGSGTVVTGTLGAGTIAVGDELELSGRPVTVRGLHSLNAATDSVTGPARVAVNLRGAAVDDVRRGDVLLTPGAWKRSEQLDVRVSAGELPERLVLHLGTAAVPTRVRPLGAGTARLTLTRAVPARLGDRAVLRDPGRHAVAAGVVVLDADPPALRRRGAAARRAAELATMTERPDLAAELRRRGVARRDHLLRLGIPVETTDEWLVDPDVRARWTADAPRLVGAWVASRPLDRAMPLGALQHELGVPDPALLAEVLSAAGLPVVDGRVGAASADLGPAEASVRGLEQRLAAAPFAAPDSSELDELRLGRRELAAAARAGRLLVLGDDIVLAPDAIARARAALATLPQPFTTSAARQALGTTRRVAIPLLEHLDDLGVTERIDRATRRVTAR